MLDRIPLRRGVLDITVYDQFCQWLVTDRWFTTGTPASSTTNKSDRYDIAEILLNMALNTIKQTKIKWFCIISGVLGAVLAIKYAQLGDGFSRKCYLSTISNSGFKNVSPYSIYLMAGGVCVEWVALIFQLICLRRNQNGVVLTENGITLPQNDTTGYNRLLEVSEVSREQMHGIDIVNRW